MINIKYIFKNIFYRETYSKYVPTVSQISVSDSESQNKLQTDIQYPNFSNFNLNDNVTNVNNDNNVKNDNSIKLNITKVSKNEISNLYNDSFTIIKDKDNNTNIKISESENINNDIVLDLNPDNYTKKYKKFVVELKVILENMKLVNVKLIIKYYKFINLLIGND
jgi:hypothetical protein